MRFQPPPTNAGNSVGDGLLYLPGLSLATPQYSCRIKWQAIYNTSVKADCTAEPPIPASSFKTSGSALNFWMAPKLLFLASSSFCWPSLQFTYRTIIKVIPLHAVISYWIDLRGRDKKRTNWLTSLSTQISLAVVVLFLNYVFKIKATSRQLKQFKLQYVCLSRERGWQRYLFLYILFAACQTCMQRSAAMKSGLVLGL